MLHVAWSVCLCVLGTACAKTAELIEIGPRNYGPDPHGKGHFLGMMHGFSRMAACEIGIFPLTGYSAAM